MSQKKPKKKAKSSKKPTGLSLRHIWKFLGRHSQQIMVIVAVPSMVVPILMCDQTARESRAVEVQERPWVFINSIKSSKISSDGHIQVIIHLKNSGQLPARVQAVIDATVSPKKPTYFMPKSPKIPSFSGLLPPGETHSIVTDNMRIHEPEEIAKQNKTLYLYGVINYLDPRNKRYLTQFCRFYSPDPEPAGGWSICGNGEVAN